MSYVEPEGVRVEADRTYFTQRGEKTRRQELGQRLKAFRELARQRGQQAAPKIQRAARYAAPKIASTGMFAAAPVRRRIQTRTTNFRIDQRNKELKVLKLQERLARLDNELRTTRYEIERLRG